MQTLQTFRSRDLLYAGAAERIAEALREGIDGHGEGSAVLSGGTTPEPAYSLLSAKALDWPKVRFALVDERFVPPDHPDSNEAMLRRALRKPLEKGARLAPMYAPTTPDNAARAADAVYASLTFDIAVMGMGGDGHTASWFPNSPQLGEALNPQNPNSVIAINAPDAAGSADRLTLTLAAVARARRVILLITGMDKFAIVGDAMQPGSTLPVAALFNVPGPTPEILWAI